jgi:hypothetical protein
MEELPGRFSANDCEAESISGRRRGLDLSPTLSAFRAWLPFMLLAASVILGSNLALAADCTNVRSI